jgi:predicted RNA-binding protein with PIN domain
MGEVIEFPQALHDNAPMRLECALGQDETPIIIVSDGDKTQQMAVSRRDAMRFAAMLMCTAMAGSDKEEAAQLQKVVNDTFLLMQSRTLAIN